MPLPPVLKTALVAGGAALGGIGVAGVGVKLASGLLAGKSGGKRKRRRRSRRLSPADMAYLSQVKTSLGRTAASTALAHLLR